MESWYSGTDTPPSVWAATCAQYRRGRLSPITLSLSPRPKPSAASPRAKSRIWSWHSRQVEVCQMPRSFSRMAGRPPNSRAFRCSSRGSVPRSPTGGSGSGLLGLAEVGVNHLRVGPDLVRCALRDLLPHVEHRHAVGDVHHDPHVVLDEDHRGAPLLV